ILTPRSHQLLRIENRNLREHFCRSLWLLLGLATLLADSCPVLSGKLCPEEVANPNKDAVLPIVEAFEPGQLVRRTGRTSAKLMGVTELGEEFDGIIDAIHPELKRVHVLCPHID